MSPSETTNNKQKIAILSWHYILVWCPPVLAVLVTCIYPLLVLCPLVLAVLAVSYILIHLLLSIGVHQFWRFWLHVFIPCCIYPLLSHQVKRSKPGGTVKKSERLYVSIFLHPEFDLRSFFFF